MARAMHKEHILSWVCVTCIVCTQCVLREVIGSTELLDEGTTVAGTNLPCDGANDTDSCITSETTTECDTNMTEVNPTNLTNSTNVTDTASNMTLTSTTTVEPQLITMVPPTAPPVDDEICFCDLTVNLCDINCCCDSDCSGQDQQVFSGCEDTRQGPPSNYHCYQPHFLYRNNTALNTVPQFGDTGLFCIVADNLPKTFQYPDSRVVKSLSEFSKLHGLTKSFGWPAAEVNSEMPSFEPPFTYKAGSIVWISKNSTLVPFSVPTSVIQVACQATQTVLYVKDLSSSCTRAIPVEDCDSSSSLSTANYHEGISVIASPHLVNMTQLADTHQVCAQNVCIPIAPYLCSSDISDVANCSKSENISIPVIDEETGTCVNIVKKAHYVFTHNGTQGIVHIEVFFWLADVPISQHFVTQSFSVSFRWAHDGEAFSSRSGRRGYIMGRPLLLGRKVVYPSPDDPEEEVEVMELGEDVNQRLTVPKAMLDGRCDAKERQVVTFGDNRRAACVLSLSISNFSSEDVCLSVQKQIFHVMLSGALENMTDAKSFNLYIGAFGDSRMEMLSEWTQIVLDRVPVVSARLSKMRSLVCRDVVTDLHLDVLGSYVGNVIHPQAKVVGVSVKLGGPKQIVFECDLPQCTNIVHSVILTSSVMFTDITEPAIVHFAEPPVFKIRLPSDFFYPFFSSTVPNQRKSCFVIIFVMMFCVLLVK